MILPLALLATAFWMAWLLPRAFERDWRDLARARGRHSVWSFRRARALLVAWMLASLGLGCVYLYAIAVTWLYATGRLMWLEQLTGAR